MDRNIKPIMRIRAEEIIGVRNRIVHGYDDIDASVVWQIIVEDLPEIARQMDDLSA